MIIPVTSLSSYIYCPRKLYMNKVLKIYKLAKVAMIKGTVRHHTYDVINKSEKDIVISIKKEFSQKDTINTYRRSYNEILKLVVKNNSYSLKSVNLPLAQTAKDIWQYIEEDSINRAKKVFSFKEKSGYVGYRLWDNLFPKISSEVGVSSYNLKIRGIIDQIEIHEDGNQVPLELKTGSMPTKGVWPGHKYQIAAYMILLGEKTGKKISNGNIKYLDHYEVRQVYLNPFLRDEVTEIRDKVINLLGSKEIPDFVKDKKKCISCELRDKCYSMSKG